MFATSGLGSFDYLVGDEHVIRREEERFYSERVVRVPGSYLTFEVTYPVPDVVPPPCVKAGTLTFGCLAPQYKITTEVVEAWSRILRESPGTRLILKNVILGQPAVRDFLGTSSPGSGYCPSGSSWMARRSISRSWDAMTTSMLPSTRSRTTAGQQPWRPSGRVFRY